MPRPRPTHRFPFFFVLCSLFLTPVAGAAAPDWKAVAAVREVDVLTTNEDGSSRDTVVWLAVLDGHGFIRTGPSTTWGDNAERTPDVTLRIEGNEYPLRVVPVADAALRERVVATFGEKYGWINGVLNVFRGSTPRIMRLDSRD